MEHLMELTLKSALEYNEVYSPVWLPRQDNNGLRKGPLRGKGTDFGSHTPL
jgi:hypothetical protein